MRNYLKVVAGFFIPAIIFSCNDEEKDMEEKAYSLFCWPSKTACDNREYGVEFSYRAIILDATTGQVSQPKIATLICCRYIQPLIDSLSAYNDSLKKYRDEELGSFQRKCTIGNDIEVFVSYSLTVGFKPGSLSMLGFIDHANPYGFHLYLPQHENFNSFKNDVMSMYRKCCLREKND